MSDQSDFFNDGNERPSFYLVPVNEEAEEAVAEALQDGKDVEALVQEGNKLALCVRFNNDFKITLGSSSTCDFTLPGIDSLQCQFEMNETTGAVILKDKSRKRSTAVDDSEIAVQFERHHHSVIVTRGINRMLFMGSRKPLEFSLKWPQGDDKLRDFLGYVHPSNPGPRLDGVPYRYVQGSELGQGASGSVYRAVNIRSGDAMAVKRLDTHGHLGQYAKGEIANMKALGDSNVDLQAEHILPIYDYVVGSNNAGSYMEIFLPLKLGSVYTLVLNEAQPLFDHDRIAQDVLYQMAKALKFLEKKNLVHRDVKPENILYDIRSDNQEGLYYHFLLADFGLSKYAQHAKTAIGTSRYMAPEIVRRTTQTCKIDIWSLFVTVVWIHDTDGFRDFHPDASDDCFAKVAEIAALPEFYLISDMASIDSKYRMSATELVSLLKGHKPDGKKDKKRGSKPAREDSKRGHRSVKEVASYEGGYKHGYGGSYEDNYDEMPMMAGLNLNDGEPAYTYAPMDGHSALQDLPGFGDGAFHHPPMDGHSALQEQLGYSPEGGFFADHQPRSPDEELGAVEEVEEDDGNDEGKGKSRAKYKDRRRRHHVTR